MNNEPLGEMLTIREVAQMLRVHPNTLRRRIADGSLLAYRVSARGDIRIRTQDVWDYIDRMRVESKRGGGARSRDRRLGSSMETCQAEADSFEPVESAGTEGAVEDTEDGVSNVSQRSSD